MAYTSDTLASGGTAYFDGSFTTPTEVALPVIEYPFPDDTSTRQITRRYWVRSGNYSASSIATNTTDSVFTLAVLTEERVVGQPGADLYEIERVYNEVPNPRQDYETYVYTYPGVNQAIITTGTAVTLTGSSYCLTTKTLSWTSPTFPAGTSLVVRSSFTVGDYRWNRGYWMYQYRYDVSPLRVNMTAAGGNAVSVWAPFPAPDISAVSASAMSVTGNLPRRNPVQKVVLSRINSDFFVIGDGTRASVSAPDQVALQQPFVVVNQYNGEPSDYIGQVATSVGSSTFTLTTKPTPSEYLSMIVNREQLLVGDIEVRPWRGNIWQRSGRWVTAQ